MTRRLGAFGPILLALATAACAASSPPAQSTTPPTAPPAGTAPVAAQGQDTDATSFDAAAIESLVRLMSGVGCPTPPHGFEPWCRLAVDWPKASAPILADGSQVLAGVTLVLPDGEAGEAAFRRPFVFSLFTIDRDASGTRVRSVVVNPESDAEKAEVAEATSYAVAFASGAAPGVLLRGGLATFADSRRGRADTPATLTKHGLAFTNAHVQGELRQLGPTLWLLVERPLGIPGAMITVLSSNLKLDPQSQPGTPPAAQPQPAPKP